MTKELLMLIEDATFCVLLRRIVAQFTADRALRDDLMQECLIRIWRLESEEPGRTRSWYLQNCRFHVQHWLACGRSVDSLKRSNGDNRVTIDPVSDAIPVDGYHTNGEFFEVINANDLFSTLTGFLKPHEKALLGGLADGLVLQDIAVKLNLSYPTVLKYRRKIAALTIKLGIPPPLPYKRQHTRPGRQPLHVHRLLAGGQMKGAKHHSPPGLFSRTRPTGRRGRMARPSFPAGDPGGRMSNQSHLDSTARNMTGVQFPNGMRPSRAEPALRPLIRRGRLGRETRPDLLRASRP
jgi:DNA-directed RNA polymerase specialized sigma24 family protein